MSDQRPAGPPTAPAAPVTVGLGRSNAVVALAVLGFLGWIVWAGARGAWNADSSSARIIGYGVAALFAVPLGMMLVALPRFLSPRRIVFDHSGLSIRHGARNVLVPWREVRAVGIAHQQAPGRAPAVPGSPDELKGMVKEYATDKVSDALHVSGARRIVLEIFPADAGAAGRFPKLKPYWTQGPPPGPGLPPFAWRFPLPPVMVIAQAVSHGAQTFAPHAWLGWAERPWSEPPAT